MIGAIKTGSLPSAEISAVIHEGFRVKDTSGHQCRLAIIDENGNVIDSSDQVAREAFNVAIASYKQLLKGMGHIRVVSGTLEKVA